MGIIRTTGQAAAWAAVTGAALSAAVLAPAMASTGTPAAGPQRITLVRARTGLALESLSWSSARKARGELAMTGEGAAEIGAVRVTASRSRGRITSLHLAGRTQGIAKSWKRTADGNWEAR